MTGIFERRRRITQALLGGSKNLREIGASAGIDLTTISVELSHMGIEGLVRREEIAGWRINRGAKTGRYVYRLESAP